MSYLRRNLTSADYILYPGDTVRVGRRTGILSDLTSDNYGDAAIVEFADGTEEVCDPDEVTR